MSKRLTVAIAQDPDVRQRLVAALTRAGAAPDAVADVAAFDGNQIPHRYVFVAIDGVAELERILPAVRSNAHVCAIAKQASLRELTQYLADNRVNHVVASHDELDESVFITAQKLVSGDIFGIEKYLPAGTPVHYVRLRDFAGRGEAISTILEFAEQSRMRRQVRNAIGQVCEELLMNALYDAPVDEHGNQVFAEVDPHDRVSVASPRPVSIRYAATDAHFVIAVRDRFGRLAKNTIVAYIEKCLLSPTQIDRKTYGAGLGLYLVANAAASYIVNVGYGVATEVVCAFDRGAKAPLRLVGVFIHPGNADKLRTGPVPIIGGGDSA